MKEKVIYYSDELNDDFAGMNIEKKPLPEDYKYLGTGFWEKLRRFVVYGFAQPIVMLSIKFFLRIKYVNKKVLKGYKKQGCFIYGNHTSFVPDAFNPTGVAYPRPCDIIINSDALAIKGLGWLIKSLGGLPIPQGFHAMARFNEAVKESIEKKRWVAIYPEAHIWRYYTKIRPFPATSFNYPVKLKAPVFSYTLVYKKRKFSKRPGMELHIDGPFFADESLPQKAAVNKLRDEVYYAMCTRAKLSNCEYVKYVYRPKDGSEAAK